MVSPRNFYSRSEKCRSRSSGPEGKYLLAAFEHQTRIDQTVCESNRTGDGFNFLKTKFPRLSEAKIKEGIFVGPQIRQLFKDSTFMKSLNRKEKRALLAFKNVCVNFLGNKNSDDYVAHVGAIAVSIQGYAEEHVA
ncbi:hypothetical protein AVEN_42633-1 [Araneus ventricosus]|uniref:Uncharacterized protein n=1 Tax=Araneus ventricosus TaxID=182803 RepID=A0A4Y2BMI5_ARAVE|nr:hypothetical protein AVEN_42633-1 [Araneus ventricosus]